MSFKIGQSTGGTHINEDLMFMNANNDFVGGYDNTTVPTNETKITASDGAANDQFGYSVAVGSGRIVVGAPLDDAPGSNSGSAYIFDLDGTQIAKISSRVAAGDEFGYSMAVGSGRIVVGAPGDDDSGGQSGSAHIFDLDGNQIAKITASDSATNDQFGWSVAVGSGRIVVGARFDDDAGSSSGSAYTYTTPTTEHILDILDY